ncbi:17059_t:CDS:2 [Funneliformis caledonium]|uniref:17059_t:CDS:1 n=1 Tax=Funneliformis caledonium TaxID=1117310 RepID=A0A9N9E983_9GLOM|nr:17059_t:CDS:2 [Funneliformis caledonium]
MSFDFADAPPAVDTRKEKEKGNKKLNLFIKRLVPKIFDVEDEKVLVEQLNIVIEAILKHKRQIVLFVFKSG